MKKTAITVPEDVLASIDEIARQRGESRSAFITRVLRAALGAKRDRAITRRLDALFADEEVADEQRRAAGQLDESGTDWSDERW